MDSSREKKSLDNLLKYLIGLKNKYSSPKIYSANKNIGLLLIEDFGENKYSTLLKEEAFYYKKAIDLLITNEKSAIF